MRFSSIKYLLLLIIPLPFYSQETYLEYELMPQGGKFQFEQVIETQLSLPEVLLTKNFAVEVKTNFSLDSAGRATDLVIKGTNNNLLKKEISRLMSFYRFNRTSLSFAGPQPYFLVFSLSTAKYKRYLKQRSRARIKMPALCDTSLAVVSRADRSPAYYRNDHKGLAEYILSDINYPPLARENSIQGTVVLEFIVETNGFVTGISAKKPVGGGCTEEAIRLIRETRWNPAVVGDKAVRYRMEYPITFSLRIAGNDVHPSSVGN